MRPQLEYTSTVWSPWQRYLIDGIEKVQRHSARYVYNDYHVETSVSALINNVHWDSLETCQTISGLLMFYKMLAAIPNDRYIQPAASTLTRHSHQYKMLPLSSTKNPFKFLFLSRTLPIWNNFPEELKVYQCHFLPILFNTKYNT